mmetsp:Transcript_29447/g.90092  ORF Transcript_29447/g.90092 Transcript_29447/m.90092 type:complete len:220 (+) Transcript_29447:533-1192(+)
MQPVSLSVVAYHARRRDRPPLSRVVREHPEPVLQGVRGAQRGVQGRGVVRLRPGHRVRELRVVVVQVRAVQQRQHAGTSQGRRQLGGTEGHACLPRTFVVPEGRRHLDRERLKIFQEQGVRGPGGLRQGVRLRVFSGRDDVGVLLRHRRPRRRSFDVTRARLRLPILSAAGRAPAQVNDVDETVPQLCCRGRARGGGPGDAPLRRRAADPISHAGRGTR